MSTAWAGKSRWGHATSATEADLREDLLADVIADPIAKERYKAQQKALRERMEEEAVRAAELRHASTLGHGFETINAALSGRPEEHSFSDSLRQDADQIEQAPLRDLKLRNTFAKSERLPDPDLDDPESPVSRTARNMVRGMLGPAATRLGPEFDRLPVSKLTGMGLDFDRLLKTDPGLQIAQSRIERTDPASPASAAARDSFKQVASIYSPNFFEQYAGDLDRMSAATIEDQLFPLMSRDAQQVFQTQRREREAAAKAEAKRARDLEREAKRTAASASKTADKNAEFFVDGFEIRPDARPRPTEVSGLRSATAFNATLKDTVREIRKLYDQYGTEALPTEAKARMAALARDLQLSAKGEELYRLGVLTGPDLSLLEELVPNPAAGKSNALAILGGSDQTLPKLETLVNQAETRLRNRAKSLGYVPRGSSKPSLMPRTVRVSNGRETLEIDPQDLPEAEADGYRPVTR